MVWSEFIKAYKELKFNDESNKEIEVSVKFCMFYFLEIVLILGENKILVKNYNFKIIENNKLCEKYPWGNLS